MQIPRSLRVLEEDRTAHGVPEFEVISHHWKEKELVWKIKKARSKLKEKSKKQRMDEESAR